MSAKKAVTNTKPTVTGVFPQPLHDGQPFTVIGTGLTVDPASLTKVEPQITIDGMPGGTSVRPVGTTSPPWPRPISR